MSTCASGRGRRSWLLGCVTAGVLVGLGCKAQPQATAYTLMGAYLEIGERLARDELDGVSEIGAALVVASEAHGDEPGVAELVAATSRLGAGDIATVRLAYAKLSRGLVTWLGAPAGAAERDALQLVYCPMAFSNTGAYWVQAAGELRNPYEGTMMLRCGARVAWPDYRAEGPPAGELALEGMK